MKTSLLNLYLIVFFVCISLILNTKADSQTCMIFGPGSVTTGVDITYTATLTNINWEVYNYNGGQAQIVHTNLDTLILNTGPTNGNYTVYVLSNPGYNVLCSLNVTIDASLPVELNSFTSTVSGNNVFLNWSTISEVNNSGFEVERSQFMNEWIKIGFVNGARNSSVPMNYNFEERNLSTGRYSYRLKQIDYNGNFQYFNLQNDVVIGAPLKFVLFQNYPNPFNPNTKINFDIPSDGFVKISVYDVSGKEIKNLVNEFKSAGYYSVNFDGSGFSGGIYFTRLEAGNNISVQKMILVK